MPSCSAFFLACSQTTRVRGLFCSAMSTSSAREEGWLGSSTAIFPEGISWAAQWNAACGVEARPAHCGHPCSCKNEKRKSDTNSKLNLCIEGPTTLPVDLPLLGSPFSECPARCTGPLAQVRTQCSIGVLYAECIDGARRRADPPSRGAGTRQLLQLHRR